MTDQIDIEEYDRQQALRMDAIAKSLRGMLRVDADSDRVYLMLSTDIGCMWAYTTDGKHWTIEDGDDIAINKATVVER